MSKEYKDEIDTLLVFVRVRSSNFSGPTDQFFRPVSFLVCSRLSSSSPTRRSRQTRL
jgi:hypothetical protein